MDSKKKMYQYDESEGQKLLRKSRQNPAFPLGITGFVLVVLYGAYKYRSKGNMKTSIYLIHLRVAAQGTVIGCLCAGLIYNMYRRSFLKEKED